MMIVVIVLAVASVVVVVGLLTLRFSRSEAEAILDHQRALAALREAEHPRSAAPNETRPVITVTDHVHILDEPPSGRSAGARRRARPSARRQPTGRSTKTRRRTPADLAERPTIASLPTAAYIPAEWGIAPRPERVPLPDGDSIQVVPIDAGPPREAGPPIETGPPIEGGRVDLAPAESNGNGRDAPVPVPALVFSDFADAPDASEPGAPPADEWPLGPARPAATARREAVVWEPLAGDRRRRRVSVVRAVAVAAVVVVGVATAGIVAAARDGSGNPSASRPPSRPITTRPRVATTQPPRPTTSTAPAPVVETAAGNGTVTVVVPFTLMLAPTGTCWVSVTNAAGQTLFEGTLQAGQHQPVVGSGPLVIRLGNTSAMTMELNGEPLDLSGVARTANVSFVST